MQYESDDNVNSLLELLSIYRRQLRELLKQRAIHGLASAPPALLYSIQNYRSEITTIKRQLEHLHVPTEMYMLDTTDEEISDADRDTIVVPLTADLELALERYVNAWENRVKALQAEILEQYNPSLVRSVTRSQGSIDIKQEIHSLLYNFPEYIYQKTSEERQSLMNELSIILLKYGYPLMEDNINAEIEEIITPKINVENISLDENIKVDLMLIATGALYGLGIGVTFGGIGAIPGALVGGLSGLVYRDRSVLHRILVYLQKTINFALEEATRDIKVRRSETIKFLLKRYLANE